MSPGFQWICYLLGALAVFQIGEAVNPFEPRTLFEWSQVEYKYTSAAQKQADINSKNLIPSRPAIIDVDVAIQGNERTYFVSTPRFQEGVPVTFGKVSKEKLGRNNLVIPYPNWSWHQNPSKCLPERLISVFRTQIDSCGRLWVLDTGNYMDKSHCPPQIIAFNLTNDQVIYRYEIPSSVLQCNSLLVNPIVDVSDGCDKTFVYAADVDGRSLIVHDVSKKTSWNIIDKTMYPDPEFGTYTIVGESFELMDGILGMALKSSEEPKKLFFHAMSSNTEHCVKISDIRNQTLFSAGSSAPEIFHTYWGRRKSQSPAEAIDKNGILYYGDVNDVTLNCWNSSTEYGRRNIRTLSSNKTILQFTSGMKVINSGNNKQDLVFVTSRFQKVFLQTINTTETNFRILELPLDQSVQHFCC